MLVTAGLNDPRVTYWEPAKWVARSCANVKTDDNVLLDEDQYGRRAWRSSRAAGTR